MIRSLSVWARALALGLALVFIIGCAETDSRSAVQPRAAAPATDPALQPWSAPRRSRVLPTETMRGTLAARGEAPGFVPGDWEYSRNDSYLAVRSLPVVMSEQFYEIVEYDAQWETNGIPRTRSRIERWSVRRGRARP